MSFGFAIGDFLAVFELATKVRDRWIDAPAEYASIKNETKNLENILRDIGKLGTRMDLNPQHEDSLKQACQSCRELLEECEKLADKYSSIQNNANHRFRVRRAWTRLKVDPDKIRHLRERFASQVTQLNALQTIIETDLTIDVRDGVQNIQHDNERRERKLVADWYSSADFADQQTDQLSRRESGTGHWFLQHVEYLYWRDHANTTLLCPGIPGSGKSMMVATVVNDLQTRFATNDDVVIAYLYCNFNRQAEQDLRRILATLVRQLFQEQVQLPDVVTALYKIHRDRATRPSTDELKRVLNLLVTSYKRVFLVIDALDECGNTEQQRDHLLDELFFLQSLKSSNVNVLATTRFIPDILQQFSTHPLIEIRADKGDIGVYLDHRMSGLARFVSRNVQLQEQIKRQITDAADGMFLLARLQFDSLCDKTNPGQIKDALVQLQTGYSALDSAYDDAMKRIELQLDGWRKLARKVLLWITHAMRELSIDELQEAVAIEPGRRDLNIHDYLDDEDQIVSVCHGLVEVDQKSRVVRLVHYTTQEYFARKRDRWLPQGNVDITRNCLAYLSMNVFAHDQCKWKMNFFTTMKQYIFLKYAGKNWARHARAVHNEELVADITKFLLNADYLRFASQITFGSKKNDPELYDCDTWDLSAIHVSTLSDLHPIVQDLVRRGEDVNRRDGFERTPLFWAAKLGRIEIVQLLLTQPDIEVNRKAKDGRPPLSVATRWGHIEIVQLLLARPEIEVSIVDDNNQTPISLAAEHGHTEIVQLLLARPKDLKINTRDYLGGRTPLALAAGAGHTETVRLLLEQPDIEVSTMDCFRETALSYAIEKQHTGIIQLLLARPDNIEVHTKDGSAQTPLYLAVRLGNREDVQQLLARPDTEINAKDWDDETPLSQAARRGNTEIVRLLLARPDIEVNTKSNNGETPLSWAVQKGKKEIARQLLTRPDIEVNTKSDRGETPLSHATEGGDEDITRLLLARPDIDINMKDEDGQTLLSAAIGRKTRAEIIELLLARPELVTDSTDIWGHTPLSLAIEKGDPATIQLLLTRPEIGVNTKDEREHRTPLCNATLHGHVEIVRQLLTHADIEVNTKDEGGRTALSWAVMNGCPDIIQLLLDRSDIEVDPNYTTFYDSLY